jgi:hypothetical protein
MIELDPVILRSEARKCRRLADSLSRPDDAAMLVRLAHEYEALAGEAESARSALPLPLGSG